MSFSSDFIWGAASAAYQIEGAASEDGRGPSVWDTFSHTPGKTFDGHTGDIACDSYHRFEEDLQELLALGVKHYRFGIGWTRIFPDGRTLNERGFAYYDAVVNRLLEHGITPWITFTINEPQCFIGLGYEAGWHAPGKQLSGAPLLTCWHNAMLAHGWMVQAVRAADPDAQVGLASCGLVCTPEQDTETDIEAARDAMFSFGKHPDFSLFSHNAFLDPAILGRYPDHPFFREIDLPAEDLKQICQPIDFIGLNFYNSYSVRAGKEGPEHAPFHRGYPRTAMRWPITPNMMYYGTKFIFERYKLPVYITENGLSCNDKIYLDGKVHDADRIDFLHRYLLELKRAASEGVDVRGYFHWSLLDNYEWSNGYEERFGLYYVNYETLERLPKDSAVWFRSVVESNGQSL